MILTIEQLQGLNFVRTGAGASSASTYKRGPYVAIYDAEEKEIKFMYEEENDRVRILQNSEIENIVNNAAHHNLGRQ